ncbi:MAG: MoxR family ATPase [Caldilineaceae bacterium]
MFDSITHLQTALAAQHYVCDHALATAMFLALKLGRPLFLEGEAGVGKTEVAKVLATVLDRELIRLQCYEGLDIHTAVYEWDYARQILQVRLMEAAGHLQMETAQQALFSPAFLLKRPLLKALESSERGAPVLLIDELDRADEEFEAFLLEVLSDFQVTVPELGTIRAAEPPIVVITSNRTREVHDALKRRCFYHWIDYPDEDKELAIVHARLPHIPELLARQVVAVVHALRNEDLHKLPGVAETLDWLAALGALDQTSLSEPPATATLGALLKTREDIRHTQAILPSLLL